MRRYKLLPVIGPFLGIVLGVAIDVAAHDRLPGQVGWSLLVAALIVVGFAELLRSVFERYFAETEWVRSILVGSSRVEGLWIDRVVAVEGGEPDYGIIDIQAAGYSVTYGGRNYDASGRFTGNFVPLMCHLEGTRLDYTYFGIGRNNLSRFGVGYVNFWHRRNYVGMFHDTESEEWYSVTGRKLDSVEVEELAANSSAATIQKLIREKFHTPDRESGSKSTLLEEGHDSDRRHLARAIELAVRNVRTGRGGPFGAVIVHDGVVVAEGANHVTTQHDPTAHAEVVAIRRACKNRRTHDLSGCVLYASCEPCPMCYAAAIWAQVDRVVYAATGEDAALSGFGDREVLRRVCADDRWTSLGEHIALTEGQMPFEEWRASTKRVEYGRVRPPDG
jgi:guanine deaminase